MEMTVGYGLIGSGTMGLVYSEALAKQVPNGALRAITGGSRAAALAAEYRVPAIGSVDEMLSRDDIGAVIIATPHTTHLPYTRACAAAGKHVYCEKPMAVTVGECDEMIAACRDAGVKLTVAAQSRQNPVFKTAKELIENGTVGEVRMIRVLSSTVGWDIAEGSWIEDPDEGGAFLDWGVHGMDILNWFIGSRATRVFATFENYGGSAMPDISTMAQYEMASGAMVQVWMSYEMPSPGLGSNMGLTIVCSKAILQMDRYWLKLGIGDDWTDVISIEGWNWLLDPKNPRRIAMSAGQLRDFSGNIIDDTEPSPSGEEARNAVEMIDYARRSAAAHRSIDIPPAARC